RPAARGHSGRRARVLAAPGGLRREPAVGGGRGVVQRQAEGCATRPPLPAPGGAHPQRCPCGKAKLLTAGKISVHAPVFDYNGAISSCGPASNGAFHSGPPTTGPVSFHPRLTGPTSFRAGRPFLCADPTRPAPPPPQASPSP